MFFRNSRRSETIEPELERLPMDEDSPDASGSGPEPDGEMSPVLDLETRIARLEAVRDDLLAQIQEGRRQWEIECLTREKQRREEQEYLAQYTDAERRRILDQMDAERLRLREQMEAELRASRDRAEAEFRADRERLDADRRRIQEQAEAEGRARRDQAEAERLHREEQDRRIEALQAELDRLRAADAARAPAPLVEGPRARREEPQPPPRHVARPALNGSWREEIASKLKKINSRLEQQFDDFNQPEGPEARDDLRRRDEAPRPEGVKRALP